MNARRLYPIATWRSSFLSRPPIGFSFLHLQSIPEQGKFIKVLASASELTLYAYVTREYGQSLSEFLLSNREKSTSAWRSQRVAKVIEAQFRVRGNVKNSSSFASACQKKAREVRRGRDRGDPGFLKIADPRDQL